MRIPQRLLVAIFIGAAVVAFLGFASTIFRSLWGHPWAEKAQDVAMFGGIGVAIIAGILMAFNKGGEPLG